ncbi:MAG: hypothetical protein ACR2OB_10175 [Solirubrobacteraceae bacterium]
MLSTPRRFVLMPFAVLIGIAVAIAISTTSPASAAPAAPGARPLAKPAKLAVGVEVLRFATAGRSIRASGLVTARLTDNAGHTNTVRTRVALTAATGGHCRVLHLFLNELTLNLLGLRAHLDKVMLDVTGNARGGVLGTLFCRLARARVASARVAAARALTAGVNAHPGHVLRFTASLNPTATTAAAPTSTCQVLDLVVGPLNLQLLGLVVDLNRVHLAVTATRGQGALGDLFCKLADNPPPGSPGGLSALG